MTVNFISERHLRQVHSVITAVAKAERWSPWEALGWLAREAELGTPGLDLIREPTTNADTVRRLPPAESLASWRDMAKRAAANKVDRNDLPVAAMTWCMCEADIAVFARSESLSSACRRALLALVPDTSPVDVPEVRAAAAPSTAATIEPAPAGGCSADAPEPAPALTSPRIADAFDGELGLSAAQWSEKLADMPEWLRPARAAKSPAPIPSTWWPLEFARILLGRGATVESLNRKFLNEPTLRPWRQKWQDERRERNAFGQ